MHHKPISHTVYFRFPNEVSYMKVIRILLSRWYWTASAMLIGLIAAYFYLYCTPAVYSTTASLKFDDRKTEISELINVRNIYDRTNKVESEKFVIRSKYVLLKALASLHCGISYYTGTGFTMINTYPKKPLTLVVIEKTDNAGIYNDFQFKPLNSKTYQLSYTLNNKTVLKTYNYMQTVSLPHLKFKIYPKESAKNISCTFRFNSQSELLEKISKTLKIDETQNVNVLMLKLADQNPLFAADLLNAIINEYLNFDKMQRAVSISQTTSFINTLLQTMSEAVKASGKAIQAFKESNQIVNISSSSSLTADRLTDLETEKHTLDIQSVLISFIAKELTSANTDKLSYDLQGITDPQLNKLIEKYNDLLVKRKEVLTVFTENSKTVSQLNEQISDFKTAIIHTVLALQQRNTKTLLFLTKQIDSIRQDLINIPGTERNFINLQSKFDIDQKVYSYLAEKKLEAQISKAAVTPGAIIIDKAMVPEKPISPVPKKIYFLFTLGSLLLSGTLIFMTRLFDPYIHNKETIEQLTAIPLIGVIRKYRKNGGSALHSIPSIYDPRSLFTESVRSVRSNLSFFDTGQCSKVICITSEVSGEGKSFVSINLAASLTLVEKRVLLIAADLRKSKLHLAFNISNRNGLSRYLSGHASYNDILSKSHIKDLDFIPSGPIPPNPSELLHNQKMVKLINDMKKEYDFIILDSAPVGLVTDGMPLVKMSNINLFIIRSGVSRHYSATTPEKLKKEFGLTNIAIILNDFENDAFHSYYYTNKNLPDYRYHYSNQTYYNYHTSNPEL